MSSNTNNKNNMGSRNEATGSGGGPTINSSEFHAAQASGGNQQASNQGNQDDLAPPIQAKRPVGRPRSKKKKTEATEDRQDELDGRPRRGRPKGSKNRAKEPPSPPSHPVLGLHRQARDNVVSYAEPVAKRRRRAAPSFPEVAPDEGANEPDAVKQEQEDEHKQNI
ncbi:hypothetical protein MCOR27_011498 [Pyricularia oryzae]|nr:hypothetical protein MCOR27_011498 [Pyricularia oryzae]KAI6274542.1 hypothetical protein MCOR34_011501 [Pyricularia oryzae]KAI6292785.1 hypothetical protein MCOR29_011644 [Pyricularia oryzae]KAI6306885.1 hypothetical protein MCOR30_011728 [Pyricularia oryzae]KAI6354936.1 hypothetical protein MCOR31_011320 [Pyricularia oryzae]